MDKIKYDLQEYERVPDMNTKHRADFNPRTYRSIQDQVNGSKEFEAYYINKLVEEGWFKLDDNNMILDDKLKGRHFKYRLNGKSMSREESGTFRSGGIIVGKNKEDENYLMYKAYNGCLFPLQLKDIQDIYIKDPNVKIEASKKPHVIKGTVYFKKPEMITDYKVTLPKEGKNVLVFSGRNKYSADRFKSTKKFEYALKTGDWALI